MSVETGEWLVKEEPFTAHTCSTPLRDLAVVIPGWDDRRTAVVGKVPDGQVGDVWKCSACSYCWQIMRNPGVTRGGYSPAFDEWVKLSAGRSRRLTRRAVKAKGLV